MVFKNTQDHVQGIDWSLWIFKKKKNKPEADKPNVND